MVERTTLTRQAGGSNPSSPAICVHLWRSVGRSDVHAKIGLQKIVHYVRCALCQQDGFHRPNSMVVYTWTKDESQWLTS